MNMLVNLIIFFGVIVVFNFMWTAMGVETYLFGGPIGFATTVFDVAVAWVIADKVTEKLAK